MQLYKNIFIYRIIECNVTRGLCVVKSDGVWRRQNWRDMGQKFGKLQLDRNDVYFKCLHLENKDTNLRCDCLHMRKK